MSDGVQGPSKLPANPADRLREAAGILRERIQFTRPFVIPSAVAEWQATVDLLEAVADDMDEWGGFMPDGANHWDIHKKAIALADSIGKSRLGYE